MERSSTARAATSISSTASRITNRRGLRRTRRIWRTYVGAPAGHLALEQRLAVCNSECANCSLATRLGGGGSHELAFFGVVLLGSRLASAVAFASLNGDDCRKEICNSAVSSCICALISRSFQKQAYCTAFFNAA